MMRILNLILAVCGLILVMHMSMTVYTEKKSDSRWAMTEEGRLGLRTLDYRATDPFLYGGDPANSALVLNFRGDEDPLTIDAVPSWIYFDFAGQGEAVKTGWVGPGLGLLVADPDENGLITSGRQLFGNRTLDGDARLMTGFEALAKLDDNGDGVIDRRDSGWARLRVWLEKKPDGRVGLNELYRPEELDITAFELNPQRKSRVLRNGNYLHSRSSFISANGRRRPLDEVFFQQRAGLRQYSDGLTVSPEVAAMAPDIKGYGRMRDLREALMQSPELREQYRRYQQASTRAEQLGLMDDLLLAWAEAGGSAPGWTERLGGRYDLSADCLASQNPDDPYLKVIEAWSGRDFYRLPHELYPGQELLPGLAADEDYPRKLVMTCPDERWQLMLDGYDRLSTYVYEELLKSTRLKRFYDLLDADQKNDPAPLLALIDNEFTLDPDKALTDLLELGLDLARNRQLSPQAAQALDDYIKAKVDEFGLTEDQSRLFIRYAF